MVSATRSFKFLSLVVLAAAISKHPRHLIRRASGIDNAKRDSCTVNSVSSASNLAHCSSVVIEAFTVPSGSTITIAAAKGATITQNGDITFAKTTASGPLLTIATNDAIYNGNGHKINGNGQLYWDGLGGGNKPHPFVKFQGYGTFESFTVLNSPANAIAVGTTAPSTFKNILVDSSAGDTGKRARNTDGFDIAARDVTLSNNTVKNQDDCIAINYGQHIVVQNMNCMNGHGISIGSIGSHGSVSDVLIQGNTITNSLYGLRIKVNANAVDATVSGVTYKGNSVTGNTKYGVLVTQSYPDDFGTPGTGSTIKDIVFTGSTTKVSVIKSAYRIGVNCGSCSGNWDFSALTATGGLGNKLNTKSVQLSGNNF